MLTRNGRIRQSNLEFMRIISMLFIVIYHFMIETGANILGNTNGITKDILLFISLLIIVHVNSFILVTGYFQYNKEFHIKRLIYLLIETYTYKAVIATVFLIFWKSKITTINLLSALSPLELGNYWFVKQYILLYILSPYINIIIEKLNKKAHLKLIIILFVCLSIIPTITNQRLFVNNGFTISHFIFMYIIGSFLGKYSLESSNYLTKNQNRIRIYLIFCYILAGCLNFCFHQLCNYFLGITNNSTFIMIIREIGSNTFYYQNPLIVIQSISYFLIFLTYSFKNKIINKLASGVLAVYLITENILVRNNIYSAIKPFTKNVFLKVLIYSIIIMAVCLIIELLRQFIMYIFVNIYYKIVKYKKQKTNSV